MTGADHRPLILARLLTRAGDHAWGLAMPLALLIAAPGTLRPLAAYYLVTRLAVVVAMPLLGRWIDEADRLTVVRAGIALQVAGVVVAAALFQRAALPAGELTAMLAPIIAAGVVAQVGATMMHVVLPGRWVPALFSGEALVRVNSRLKQSDLVSEVVAPVAAGSLIAFASSPAEPYRGFHLVALVNLGSFALEYALLARVYRAAPQLAGAAPAPASGPAATGAPGAGDGVASGDGMAASDGLAARGAPATTGASSDLDPAPELASALAAAPSASALRTFLAQATLPVMLAYGLLWFTVLTPHGALLTSFLKMQWGLDEQLLGLVRGVGALCGLAPTLIYARLVRALGTRTAAASCILLQLVFLVVACLSLSSGSGSGLAAAVFITALMVSRIGLYGFVLAEVQIFQESVPDAVRGRVGAAASSYNNALGLAIYAAALVVSDPAQFPVLAWASCASVGLAALLVTTWAMR